MQTINAVSFTAFVSLLLMSLASFAGVFARRREDDCVENAAFACA
jgi:hypothetical protein